MIFFTNLKKTKKNQNENKKLKKHLTIFVLLKSFVEHRLMRLRRAMQSSANAVGPQNPRFP